MKHHHTRRKGRNLKKQGRTTRRRQQGGAAIASINDWFKAIDEFEARKGGFDSNYSFASLTDPELTLPTTMSDIDREKFMINDVNVSYPPYPLPDNYTAPEPVSMSLIEAAQIIAYLFNGEDIGEGLLNQGYNTLSAFIQYVNSVKTVLENTENPEAYENKRTVWFLNELESALQRASGKDTNVRGFKSIYDTPKFPFYIMYLAANPITLPDRPMLAKIDPSMIPASASSTQQAPSGPGA